MMTHGSCFSGIGGFDLAAQWAGIETTWQIENNPFCQKVLRKNFPEAKIYGDIYETRELEPVDIITGGFPCQPFSQAGKRQGKADDRYLWPEMLRIITEVKPTWIIAENVAGIINMALDQVLFDLEMADYSCQTIIIPACAVNAPHRRDRVWIIANRNSKRCEEQWGNEPTKKEYPGDKCNHQIIADTECIRRHDEQEKDRQTLQNNNRIMEVKEQSRDKQQCRFGKSDSNAAANTSSKGFQKLFEGQLNKPSLYAQRGDWEQNWVEVATRLCGIFNGLSTVLDETIRRITHEEKHDQESIATVDEFRREALFLMWCERKKVEPTSYRNETGISNDCLHEMPHELAYEKWNLGERIKKTSDLQNLWQTILSSGFSSSYDMQSELLIRIREIERNEKALSYRVDRLKALGNSIVPQIAYIFFSMIKELEAK